VSISHITSPVSVSHITLPVSISHITSPVSASHITLPVSVSHITLPVSIIRACEVNTGQGTLRPVCAYIPQSDWLQLLVSSFPAESILSF